MGLSHVYFTVDGVRFSRTLLLERLSESYCYVVGRQLEQLAQIPEERKFYTRYEDWLGNIHGALYEIDSKFELDSGKRKWDRIPKTQVPRNDKFKKDLSRQEIELISSICRSMMEHLGYDPDGCLKG